METYFSEENLKEKKKKEQWQMFYFSILFYNVPPLLLHVPVKQKNSLADQSDIWANRNNFR